MTSQIPRIVRHYYCSNSITHDVQAVNHADAVFVLKCNPVYSGITPHASDYISVTDHVPAHKECYRQGL